MSLLQGVQENFKQTLRVMRDLGLRPGDWMVAGSGCVAGILTPADVDVVVRRETDFRRLQARFGAAGVQTNGYQGHVVRIQEPGQNIPLELTSRWPVDEADRLFECAVERDGVLFMDPMAYLRFMARSLRAKDEGRLVVLERHLLH